MTPNTHSVWSPQTSVPHAPVQDSQVQTPTLLVSEHHYSSWLYQPVPRPDPLMQSKSSHSHVAPQEASPRTTTHGAMATDPQGMAKPRPTVTTRPELRT